MSFKTIKNLGLGILILLLIATALLARQQNRSSLQTLQHLVSAQLPAYVALLRAREELLSAQHLFDLFQQRNRTTPEVGVSDAIAALESMLQAAQARPGGADPGLRPVSAYAADLRLLLEAYLDEQALDPWGDTVQELAADLTRTSAMLQDEVSGLMRMQSDRARPDPESDSGLAGRVRDLAARIDSVIRRYTGRDQISLQPAYLLIERVLANLRRAAGSSLPRDAGSDLDQLSDTVSRYRSAIEAYETREAGSAGANPEQALIRQVNTLWEQADIGVQESIRSAESRLQDDHRDLIRDTLAARETGDWATYVLVLCAILVSVLIGRLLTQRLRRLANATARVAAGDLDVRLEPGGTDEFGRLAGSFNTMAEELARRTLELEQTAGAAEAASRAKSLFLAKMSHELRTPLTGILGHADLLAKSPMAQPQSRHLATIRQSGADLLRVIDDLLDFSQLETGRLELHPKAFDLRALLEQTLEGFANAARTKGLELSYLLPGDIPTGVRGDPGRLGQVLASLVNNGIKFSKSGEIAIVVSVGGRTDRNLDLRFAVHDSGIGVDAQDRQRIFESFSQGDDSLARRYGGTGLGLSIAQALVGVMGGEIGVNSRPDEGAEFWFTVVLEPAPQAAVVEPAPLPGDGRVLLVQAHTLARQALTTMLQCLGAEADSVATPAEALAWLQNASLGNTRLVLMDAGPEDAAGLTRALPPPAPPVAFMGWPDREYGITPDQAAACRLDKPVRLKELRACLDRSLTGAPTPAVSAAADPLRAAAGPSTPLGLKVLVAEDNPVNQFLLVEMLHAFGCRVHTVGNGEQALQALENQDFDIVLMDCQMPELDGYEAVGRVRRKERETNARHLPVVALTANAMIGDREKAVAAGMDDYLAKPFETRDLRDILIRWTAR